MADDKPDRKKLLESAREAASAAVDAITKTEPAMQSGDEGAAVLLERARMHVGQAKKLIDDVSAIFEA